MDQKYYNVIKETIDKEYQEKMGALELLFGQPLKQDETPFPHKKIARPSAKKVIASLPTETRGVIKTTPCEFIGCIHRVHAENKACPECTKKLCSKHKRDEVCNECKSR